MSAPPPVHGEGLLGVARYDASRDEALWERALAPAIESILVEACSWIGTPHRAGQQCKGVGVDCTHLAAAVLDHAFRRLGMFHLVVDRGPCPRAAQDSGMHEDAFGSGGAHMAGAARWMLRRYPLRLVEGASGGASGGIQPLDVLAMRLSDGADSRANHAAVALEPFGDDASRGRFVHATGGPGGRVCLGSLRDASMARRVAMVFRPCCDWRSG